MYNHTEKTPSFSEKYNLETSINNYAVMLHYSKRALLLSFEII
jgi:hypothetical protein